MAKVDLNNLLKELVELDGSDLHIKAYEPPVFRVLGQLKRTDYPPLTPEDTKELIYGIMNEERIKRFEEFKELDLSYEVDGVARFRVNVFRQKGYIGAAFRLIPIRVKTIDELELPPILKKIAMLPRGFVLVTGPTGSGKSTTLAAVMHHINQQRRCNIITVEDPIEYVHTDILSAIHQRELGIDTHSFAAALRHVLRQNPDIILVGEMRDYETIQLAITAAETGQLVFSTLHTTDAAQTVDRMIQVFPPQQQAQVRTQVSLTLQAVFCQTLLPRKDGSGRIAAFEIMIANHAIRSLIREGKTHQIYNIIQSSQEEGMRLLDEDLLDLFRRGKVSYEHALAKSASPSEFAARAGRT